MSTRLILDVDTGTDDAVKKTLDRSLPQAGQPINIPSARPHRGQATP